MAIGMNKSDVSDDDSSSSSESNLAELVQTQEVIINKLMAQNKDLKEKLDNSSSNYQELVEKFDIIMDDNDELSRRIEILENANATSPKSTSCIDSINKSCSPPCNETCVKNVVVESCDNTIAKENDELKQEVDRLMKDLVKLKGKSDECKSQPPQDNRPKMVKKLAEGETVTCYSCKQKGHKSYECKNKKKEEELKKKNPSTMKPYLKVDKKKSTPYLLKKKNDKVVALLINKQGKKWNQPIWVPKEIIATMKGSKKVWVPKTT